MFVKFSFFVVSSPFSLIPPLSFCYTFHMPIFDTSGLGWSIVKTVYHFADVTAFVWGPVLLVYLAAKAWLAYKQAEFIAKFEWVMLEIKLPRVIEKTPLAMELVLPAFHITSTGTWYDRWFKGKVKPWFSLEMMSDEGDVRFFVRTPTKYKRVIESHIYAQYPDIEVHESEDYVKVTPYLKEPNEWSLWGCEFALTKPDPYPIKTYVDYKLDSTLTKEEMKSDPITSVIEFLGSVGRGQTVWFQILVQATGRRFSKPGLFAGRHDWKEEGKKIIAEIKAKSADAEGREKSSKQQSDVIAAIERSLGQFGFDCGIRALYIARREAFDPSNIGGIAGAFQQYSSQVLNGFKPTHTTEFDYPWQDYKGMRLAKLKKRLYDAYVRRSYFYMPYMRRPFVLSSEELATIFHFPGGVAETPTFSRIDSRKGEPPSNLPI